MTPEKFVFSLSFAQERLWFLEQFEPDSSLYLMEDMGVRIIGDLDIDALRDSMQTIQNRHETLRTNFDSIDGRPVQVVDETREIDFTFIELDKIDRDQRESEALQIATREIRRPLDLKEDNLFKVFLVELNKEDHILFFVIHHIISDGLSINLLIKELGTLYSSTVIGQEIDLPDLPIQYADFANWQKEWLQGDVLSNQLEYWKNQLEDIPSLLDLPIDNPRKAIPGYQGGRYTFNISPEVIEGLERLSRNNGATLYMTLLASVQSLLYRFTGQEDILIGSPVAGRTQVETRNLIGLFVNTLILRTDLGNKPTFLDLISQVRDTTLTALENQDIPFEKLVAELQPDRNMSHTPFFQVMFAIQDIPVYENFNDLLVTPIEINSGRSRFDLVLSMLRNKDQIQGRFIYDRDLFDEATIHRMVRSFLLLLDSIVASPNQPVATLPILTSNLKNIIINDWNDTFVDYHESLCFHELFEHQVELDPDKDAVIYYDDSLTYQELNSRANQFARYLRELGVGPEVLVGISLDRSLDLIVAVIGILKAGGAYLPLDPTYPNDRLEYMLSDSRAPILIANSEIQGRLELDGIKLVDPAKDWSVVDKYDPSNPRNITIASNLAYVIYTSGSTGYPKGTLISHKGLGNVQISQRMIFNIDPNDRILQFASLNFDMSTFDMICAFGNGATLLIGDKGDLMPGPDLQQFVNEYKPTFALVPPSAMQALPKEDYESLRTIAVGGDICSSELVDKWANEHAFFNLYGPTETTIWSTYFRCSMGTSKPPIGAPIKNTQLYVLDDLFQPVPIGVKGELFIGGVSLGRGYHLKPGMTSERFVPNPFGTGDRLYRTGDLVKWLPDGNVDFLGRKDHQIKIRGFRIELGEIENSLQKFHLIKEAVVIVDTETADIKRLIAYIVLESATDFEVSELRRYLGEQLPDYMIPSVFMVMAELPLNQSGKIDRSKLPEPERIRPELQIKYTPPRTPIEEAVADIWGAALDLDQVGVFDDFFELGGYSLLVTQIISRIEELFETEIRLQTFFSNPTVAGISEYIDLLRKNEVKHGLPPITPAPSDEDLPLSYSQQRLWFINKLVSDSPLYNVSGAIWFSGQLEIDVFRKSINAVVQRHDVLRTSFPTRDGEPIQVKNKDIRVDVPFIDLSMLPEIERMEKYEELKDQEAKLPFDLEIPPLLRVTVIKFGSREYVCFFSMHHIISDHWSNDVFVRELAGFYSSYRLGVDFVLPDLSIQYADYSYWQKSWLRGTELNSQLAFWEEKLGDVLEPIYLPLDYPRPPRLTFEGASEEIEIPASLHNKLNDLSKRYGATLFMTLLAAFQSLLHRYSHQDYINIGTPITNRDRAPLTDLIGFFVNTVVMSSDFSGDPSFRLLLEQVKNYALDAYAHRDLPFEMLVDELNLQRDLSHSPLFQVMFVLQNSAPSMPDLPGLKATRFEILDSGLTRFDLTLSLTENPDGLKGRINYSSNLFNQNTIRRMIEHFRVILEGIVSDPELPISGLPILTGEEKQKLLVNWNFPSPQIQIDNCVHTLIEEISLEYPDEVAVIFREQSISFQDLNARANQLARFIRSNDFNIEGRVGICLERCAEVAVAILAVLKAGGVYLPLDPEYPKARLEFMLSDSDVDVLITNRETANRFFDYTGRVIDLDRDSEDILKKSDGNLEISTLPDNLAYIIYTSGSTGKPKGVQLTHRGLINIALAQIEIFQLKRGDRTLQFASLSFDASISEIFTPLMSGSTIVFAPPVILRDPARLVEFINEYEITTITLPPTMLRLLPKNELLSLKTIVSAGERFDWEMFEKFREGRRLVNGYGPTEVTVGPTLFVLEGRRLDCQSVPIGSPIKNTQVYVLDKDWNPAPIGVQGELYVGGVGVARGYLGRPGLTAERFVPNLFSDGERLYRTGDIVRWLEDGNLEFIGREDEQVKVRGFRIELGEIENLLIEFPGCLDSVVMVQSDEVVKSLVAYLVQDGDVELHAAEIREYLLGNLPGYMVPGTYVALKEVPLTSSGKVDRKLLSEMESIKLTISHESIEPRNDLEIEIAELWFDILDLDQVSINQNFFELGGDSIKGAIFINRFEKLLGQIVPVVMIFEAPTIELFAGQLLNQYPEDIQKVWGIFELTDAHTDIDARDSLITQQVPLPDLLPVNRADEEELSFSQQRLWFLDQLVPDSPYYNMPGALRLKGVLRVDFLEESLNEIVSRHEILRTTFRTIKGKPHQIVDEDVTIQINPIDLCHLPEGEREKQVLAEAIKEARTPFNLSEGPLLRIYLLHLNKDENILLLNMHHIVSDGWSMGVLVRELGEIYQALVIGSEPELPELPIQYADYSSWQRSWLKGEILESQLDYWRRLLDGIPKLLELPIDRPRPAVQNFNGAHKYFKFPQLLSDELIQTCRNLGVTQFTFLLTTFQSLLYRYTGQEIISVGTPTANRNRQEIESLIGFFVNTLVIRADFPEKITFNELLDKAQEFLVGAYANQDIPFELLVDEISPDRDLSYTPLFQVMFVFQNTPLSSLNLPGLSMETLTYETGISKFDITLSMQEDEGSLLGMIEYSTDLFDGETIDQFVTHYLNILQAVINDPGTRITNLPILDDMETQKVIKEWNEREKAITEAEVIHERIEKVAEEKGEVEAVRYKGESLSYKELNGKANQLGRYLKEKGVGEETPVGVCLKRSAEVVEAILGILKAGGAYLPLDPEYPEERLKYMMEDAGIEILITHQEQKEKFKGYKGEIIEIERDREKYQEMSEENLEEEVRGENLAYIIYTSGSTGKPKGVEIGHKGLVNLVEAQIKGFELKGGDRVLQFAALSFDASVSEIFTTMVAGGTLVMADREEMRDGKRIDELCREEGINVVTLPPTLLRVLPEAKWPEMRTIVSAGEQCEWEIVEKWGKKNRMVNAYGPTEMTVGPTYYEVREKREDSRSVPIGKGIQNIKTYVLDRNMEPVPVGVTGILYLGGAGLARGYRGKAGMTAERFVPNPYGEGERIYKTGDKVRWLRDGNIEYIGREDEQVKVRGYRIELGEIGNVLGKYEGSEESVVVVRKGEKGRNQLAAYIVPKGEWKEEEIRGYMREQLPGYMVPGHIVKLEEMPKTPSGKIDRKGLPEIDGSRQEGKGGYKGPRTEEEKKLAEIWREVLGMEKVGVKDNFFEMGGDSILSIQIVAQAQAAGMGITPQQLFQNPTIEGLAAVADQKGVVEAEQGLVTGEVALTPIQRWFFERELPEAHYWNQTVMVKVKGGMEKEHLEGAVGAVQRHHDALRSRYYQEEGEWRAEQKGEGVEAEVEWEDLRDVGVEEKRGKLEKSAAEYQKSLDLGEGPLMRVVYYEMGEGEEDRLLVVVHHLVVDGVSWRIILEDLVRAYEQEKKGEEVKLPAKTTSYQKWAERIEGYAQSEEIEEEEEYWLKEKVGGKERLPVDKEGGENTVGVAEVVRVEMGEEKTRALLQDVPPVYNTKIQEVMLTAMVRGFSRWTGNNELLLDMEGHGRVELFEDVDVSRTVGWFTSVYPVGLRIEAGSGPGEALKEVKEQVRGIPKEGIGYGVLRYKREEEGLTEKMRGQKKAEVSFNYLGQMDQVLGRSEVFEAAEEDTGMPFSEKGERAHLIEMNALVVEKKLRMSWTYSSEVHRKETIEKLAEGYEIALTEIIEHCQSPDAGGYTPSDFPDVDLDQDDLDALLEEIDDTLFE